MSLFENFFEKQQHHRHNSQQEHAFGRQNNHYGNHQERHGEYDSNCSHSRDRNDFSHHDSYIQKLIHNKTLLILGGLLLVTVIGLAMAALAFLWPLVPKLLSYLDINGLKTVLEQGLATFEKISAIGGK